MYTGYFLLWKRNEQKYSIVATVEKVEKETKGVLFRINQTLV
jgi:hypothetical protein